VVPTDIAMVIDLSGSMNNDSTDPPQPLTDALAAASSFSTNLNDNDAIGLVTFASTASLVQPLTQSAAMVANDILALTIDPVEETGFTNTKSALEVAATELNSVNHNPDARRVMIVLTDGLPTDADDERLIIEETTTLAAELNTSGIELYSIGLGEGVDRDIIKALASTNDQAYFAPNSADLDTIYSTITSSLCESGPTRIDVLVKPQPDFTSLR
jgi:Ca-activated chloride channel family protein